MPTSLMFGAARRSGAAAILGALTACATGPSTAPATGPVTTPAPVEDRSASPRPLPPSAPATAVITRPQARWVAATWAELPGWEQDASAELWPTLLRGCDKPAPEWAKLCAEAQAAPALNDAAVRAWLKQRLQPWRVEAPDGNPEGLATGYFEPLIEARRTAQGAYRVPLYAPPPDLAQRSPYWTRQQQDTLPEAKAALRGRELAFVADPLDALLLQIQGSGRLHITAPGGQRQLVRVAYAAHNDQPYKSIGRWLIDQGELRAEQASWPTIKAWAQRNPKRVQELLWANPRVVYFREEPLPNPQLGPKGAQNVPLTPGRSIAVNPQSVPYGTPVWLDTTEPLSATPLRRLVMAQDTGSAITGAVRADYFWGWGDTAEQQAGRMKQALRMWVLWPKR